MTIIICRGAVIAPPFQPHPMVSNYVDPGQEADSNTPPARVSATARKWSRWLWWMAWLLPVALSLGVYLFVWRGVARGLPAADVQQADNLLLIGLVVSTLVGVFIYQVQIILARQLAASAELERRVEERTRHLRQALEQLDRQNQELLALDQQKSEFVTLVSHELRSPLASINGGLELLLRREQDLPPRAREALGLVAAEGQRLTHFVRTILDVSALESGQLPLELGPASLAAPVRRVGEGFASSHAAQRLSLDIPDDLPLVLGDERYLQSVIFHLVDNALKYAPEGAVTVAAQACPDGWVELRVSDQGPGLPPEAEARLFEKFERLSAKDSQAVYGHGLGLYMCRRIVEACSGEIRAEATPKDGRGASFVVRLPAWQEAS
jgi:signal transduction histidine kinase